MAVYVDDNMLMGSDCAAVDAEMESFQTWALDIIGLVFKVAKDRMAARQQLAPVAPEPAVAAPPGARCCDALLFGRGGRERARAAAQQRRRGGGSRAGLLVVGGGGPEDADGALREALMS